jgi:heterodisulfide reductase subunit A
MVVAKQAREIRSRLPETRVSVFYTDVRTVGKGAEEFFDQARAQGALYRRASVSEINRCGDRVVILGEDTLLQRPIECEADLVVLATGMEARRDASEVAALLKLPRSRDGFFLELHPKLQPVATSVAGVFLAGTCQGPKGVADTIVHARAAASSAITLLLQGTVLAESATAEVDAQTCTGCAACVGECPYGALTVDQRWGTARINVFLCQGCGACGPACPSNSISLRHFTAGQVLAQVDALVG